MSATRFTIGEDHWDFDPDKLSFQDALALEKQVGIPFGQLEAAANTGSVVAAGALFWLARRQSGDPVTWSELNFNLTGVEWSQIDDDGNVIPDDSEEPPESPLDEAEAEPST
jgi:hypothetical protein